MRKITKIHSNIHFLHQLILLYGLKSMSIQKSLVGNKVIGRISNRVSLENRACQSSRKTNISYPLYTHTHVCESGGKKCLFFGKLGVLCFLETPVLRFARLPYYRLPVISYNIHFQCSFFLNYFGCHT